MNCPINHQPNREYGGRHRPGIYSGRLRRIYMRMAGRAFIAACRRAGEDIVSEIHFLFEGISLVVAFLVDTTPQPFQ